jgi:predicted nicotinamide N-methyase
VKGAGSGRRSGYRPGMHSPPPGFDVVEEEMAVAGHRLRLAHPRCAEELIDEDDYARDERLPYWAELWPSARVLAGAIAAGRPAGRRVLELGCGVGLPAVVAALAGAQVLATDWYAEALAFTRANAAAAGARLETILLDWGRPAPELLARAPFDLVVGADLLYEERNGRALARLLPRLLPPGGEALIADPRRPHALALTQPLERRGWRHRIEEARHAGRADEAGPVIRLHRLIAPGPPPRASEAAAVVR